MLKRNIDLIKLSSHSNLLKQNVAEMVGVAIKIMIGSFNLHISFAF